MLKKIKNISWVEWLLIGGFVILLLGLPLLVSYLFGETDSWGTLYSPWSHAVNINTEIAIEEFRSGQSPDEMFLGHRLMAFLGILLFYIIGPGLLIINGIGTSAAKQENDSRGTFQVGLVLVLAGIINLGLEAAISPTVQQNSRESAAVSELKDQMRHEMLKIGIASYEHYVLPDSLGGNGGSFEGLSLDDIDGELDFSTTGYRLVPVTDTLVKIVGVKPSPSPAVQKDSIRLVAHSHPNTIMDWQQSN